MEGLPRINGVLQILIDSGVEHNEDALFFAYMTGLSDEASLRLIREVGVTGIKDQIRKFMDESVTPFSKFQEDARFVPKLLADHLMKYWKFKTTRDNETMFVYDSSHYRPIGEVMVKEQVERILEKEAKRNRVNEVIGHVQRSSYMERDEFNKDINLVNIENGIYNLENKVLEQHDANKLFTFQLPVNYEPDAKCPIFLKFLNEILYPEDIPFIQEFLGFSLYRSYFLRKVMVMYGSGANGKTTLILIIEKVFGKDNISGVSLQLLGVNRFATSDMFGKHLNIADDLPRKPLSDSGEFKKTTGGSRIRAERKGKDAFDFIPFAKQIYACNQLPQVDDQTDAYFDRMGIITFPYKFVSKPNPNNENERQAKDRDKIVDECTSPKELSGIFNWALEGLIRLREQGYFSNTKSTEEVRRDYNLKADPVAAFTVECIEQDWEYEMNKKDVYARYITFCRNKLSPPLTYDSFCKRFLQVMGEKVREKHAASGDKRIRVWVGIKLVDFELEVKEQSSLSE